MAREFMCVASEQLYVAHARLEKGAGHGSLGKLSRLLVSTYIDILRQHLIRDLIFLQYVVIHRSTCHRRTKQEAEESRIE
jgi:hypothetical protein